MFLHADGVHEAGKDCLRAIIETGRCLIRAKAEISPRHWQKFVGCHLELSETTMRPFVEIAGAFGDDGVDMVNA